MGIGTRSPKPRSAVPVRTGRYAILCSGRQRAVETEGFQAAGRACIYAVARLLQAARRRRGEGTPPLRCGANPIRISQTGRKKFSPSLPDWISCSMRSIYRNRTQHPCSLNLWGQRCVRFKRRQACGRRPCLLQLICSGACITGSRNVKQLPLPGAESTVTLPPSSVAYSRTMARPKP